MIKEGREAWENKILTRWLLVIAVFLILGVILVGAGVLYTHYYQGKIYPGVTVGDLQLGGKNKEQARGLLQAKVDQLTDAGITFRYESKKETIGPIMASAEGLGNAYELWDYDLDKTIEKIYAVGRGSNWRREWLYGWWGRINIEPEYQIKTEELKNVLREKFSQWEDAGQEAQLVFIDDQPTITGERAGRIFDYAEALGALQKQLKLISSREIDLKMIDDTPKITKERAEGLLEQAEQVVSLAPIVLKFQSEAEDKQAQWAINKNDWRNWLKIKDNTQGEVYLGIDNIKAEEWLKRIAVKIDRPAKDARFKMENGRVVEFQAAQDGLVLDVPETIKELETRVVRGSETEIALILRVDISPLAEGQENDFGVGDLVGHGESNFFGSPSNRVHNIKVGAAALNGVLIKPGEEFSINKTLGEIDASTGYKPELVIKEGKTTPEYGGGLCQIGTTLFRLAINTGLPITERRNHSYRVIYYEPAGTDATIYDPWPDLKFINDTGNYLLLQTKIEGIKAYFDFWGTKDGREVATTTPVIYNIVKPAETKIVETDELKPGEKKCTEKAHNGADAYFKRTIVWPEETGREPSEEIFRSHYVPWQEVCLVGKVATSTVETVETQ